MLKMSPLHHVTQGNSVRLQRPIAKRKAKIVATTSYMPSSASRPNRSRKASTSTSPIAKTPSGSRSTAARKTLGPLTSDKRTSSGSRLLKAKRAKEDLLPSSHASASPPSSVEQTMMAASPNLGSSAQRKPVRARPATPRALPTASLPVSPPIAATDQTIGIEQSTPSLSDTVAAIKEQYRRRQDFLQEEGSLSRRIKKIVARLKGQMTATDTEVEEMSQTYFPLIPFLDSLKLLRTARLQEEKKLKKHAETLPVWESFGHPVHGFGSLSLGAIIGEAGDLSIYSNPAKLWKRMGLALIGNERQRKCLDKEKAEQHGYSPRRRSVMFVIGDNIVKGKSAYRTVYDERKVREIEKAKEEALTVAPAAKIPKGKHAEFRSEGHIHLRAKRYMEKRLLRDLWRAWRGHYGVADQKTNVSPCSPNQEVKS